MGAVNNLQTKLESEEGYFADADGLVSHRIVRVCVGGRGQSQWIDKFIRSQKGVNAFDPTPKDTHRESCHLTSHRKLHSSASHHQIHPFITSYNSSLHHPNPSRSLSHTPPSHQINFQFKSPISKSQICSNQQLNPDQTLNL